MNKSWRAFIVLLCVGVVSLVTGCLVVIPCGYSEVSRYVAGRRVDVAGNTVEALEFKKMHLNFWIFALPVDGKWCDICWQEYYRFDFCKDGERSEVWSLRGFPNFSSSYPYASARAIPESDRWVVTQTDGRRPLRLVIYSSIEGKVAEHEFPDVSSTPDPLGLDAFITGNADLSELTVHAKSGDIVVRTKD